MATAKPKVDAGRLHPIGSIRTEVTVPIFPLSAHCRVCALYHSDQESFERLERDLLMGVPRHQILAWLRKAGHKIAQAGLYRHYQRHVEPYVRDALEFERRLRTEVRVLEGETEINIGAVFARKLAADGLAAARNLNLPSLLSRITDGEEAVSVLREFTRLCKALADIDRAQAEIALKEKLVELRALDIAQRRGDLNQIAVRWLRYQLRDHPEIAEKIFRLLDPIIAQGPKALTTGNAESPAPRTRTQRPVPRGKPAPR